MIRILHIFHNMGNGGIETYVMNIYHHIDREKIQFDFLTSVDEQGYFDNEIDNLGGRLFHAYPFKKNPVRNYLDIAHIVRENGYQIVHRHTGSAFGYYDLRAAKHGGAQGLILHSHNPQAGKPLLHIFCNIFLKVKCTKLACSQEAGEFLFGKSAKFTVLKNGIETKKFAYSENFRKKYRTEWSTENFSVIGHVGRFENQKNHFRLIDIFSELCTVNPNYILVCVGEGSLQSEIKGYAEKLGVIDNIRFLGGRNDVNHIINAFDVFCLPSFYEGFGITLIEAQANGLHCIASKDVIPEEANVSGNVTFVSLDECDETWAKAIINGTTERDFSALNKIKKEGYDIEETSKELLGLYQSLVRQEVV